MTYFAGKIPKIDKVAQGKQNRLKGAAFERKVRKHLESEGWIVDKWTNNVELSNDIATDGKKIFYRNGKIIPAKSNRFNMRSCGFPDFLAFKRNYRSYKVIAVECKTGKYLDKEEKAKVQWYLDNNIFGKIYVAYDDEGEIKFIELKKEVKDEDDKTKRNL